jgi:hypothetical protein
MTLKCVNSLIELLRLGIFAHDDAERLDIGHTLLAHDGHNIPHELVLPDLGEGRDHRMEGAHGVRAPATLLPPCPFKKAVCKHTGIIKALQDALRNLRCDAEATVVELVFQSRGLPARDDELAEALGWV